MPFRDRTGPTGRGPATGRGMGWCREWISRKNYPRKRLDWFRQKISPDEEKKLLKKEAVILKENLTNLEKRIRELENN